MTSAYPIADEVLVDKVRALADELGAWPSKRRVMKACSVGAPRASAALDTLRAEGFDPTPRPTLTAVPDAPVDEPQERTDGATAGESEAASDGTAEDHSDGPHSSAESLVGDAAGADSPGRGRRVPRWPLLIIALGAFVSIWGGWIGLGRLTGFGRVQLLPGIADSVWIDSAITLPLGVEAYAAFAMWSWMAPPEARVSDQARRFARTSALAALGLGALGQIAYHLMTAAEMVSAPWPIVALVACVPVGVLGAGAALIHLLHGEES